MPSLIDRANVVLAGGPGTFSKHWSRYPQGIAPEALVSGEGCYVTGSDGKTYLDTVAALGPIILGYGHPAVTEAVLQQVGTGSSFSMMHPLEIEVAELLCDLIPCAEMVRFMRNGTDATSTAVRLARAYTGHEHVIYTGYHGGAMDGYGATTTKHAGILPENLEYNHQIPWGNMEIPEYITDDLAAVMVEIPALEWGTSDVVYRKQLIDYQQLAHDNGALFILDEVVSFPRFSIHGAQFIYDVPPDLCTISKGMANGFPIAALVGKRRYMERFNNGDIFASWTFAGETTGLAACKATLETLLKTGLTNLHDMGAEYAEFLVETLEQYRLPATVYGHPARIQVRWQNMDGVSAEMLRTIWLAEHAKRLILLGIGVIFPQACWGEKELVCLKEAAYETSQVMRQAIDDGCIENWLSCPIISDVLSVRT